MILDVNSLHLWIFDSNLEGDIDETMLSDQELERCAKYVYEKDRRMALITRVSIRKVLSQYSPEVSPKEWEFETNEYGRPYVSELMNKHSIFFSISHSKDLLIILISKNMSSGVDVEWINREVNIDLACRYYTSLERAQIENSKTEMKSNFIKIWTLKESFIKAIGRGFHYPMSNLSFFLPDNTYNKVHCWINDDKENGRWSFFSRVFGNDYFYSLALKEDGVISVRQLCTYIVNNISNIEDNCQVNEILDLI